MHRNLAMLYFFALNKSKTIPFYYSSPIIEIGIIDNTGFHSTKNIDIPENIKLVG